MAGETKEESANEGLPRWVDWAVSSGLATALVAGAIWVGSIDEKVSSLKEAVAGLDNTALGNRITALEVAIKHADLQQDRMEHKIDRLLERRYRLSPSNTPTRDDP